MNLWFTHAMHYPEIKANFYEAFSCFWNQTLKTWTECMQLQRQWIDKDNMQWFFWWSMCCHRQGPDFKCRFWDPASEGKELMWLMRRYLQSTVTWDISQEQLILCHKGCNSIVYQTLKLEVKQISFALSYLFFDFLLFLLRPMMWIA